MNHAVRLVLVLPLFAAPTNAGAVPPSVTLEFIMRTTWNAPSIAENGQVAGIERIDNQHGAVTRFTDGIGLERIYENSLDSLEQAWVASTGQVAFMVSQPGARLGFRKADGGPFELIPGGQYTELRGMNDAGVVWGNSPSVFEPNAFTFDQHFQRITPAVANSDRIGAMNDQGDMTLVYRDFPDPRTGSLRMSPFGWWLDIGSLGGDWTSSSAMNNHGDIVGFGTDSKGQSHAFLFTESAGLQALPTPVNSLARDINDARWVVGHWFDTDAVEEVPYLWTPQSGLLRLNDLLPKGIDAQLFDATSINNAGQIVGTGWINGEFAVYRLTVHTLPTPGALAMFAVGLAFAARRRRPTDQPARSPSRGPNTRGLRAGGLVATAVVAGFAPTNARAEPPSVTLEFIMQTKTNSPSIAENGQVAGIERIDDERGAITRFTDGVGLERIFEGELHKLHQAWVASTGQVAFRVDDGSAYLNFRRDDSGPYQLITAGESTTIFGMNDHGAVWGQAWRPPTREGFVFDSSLQIVPTPVGRNGRVGGLNEVGDTALIYQTSPGFRAGTLRINADGSWVDVGSLYGGDTVATAMNNRGDIVGFGSDPIGLHRAFLFTDEAGIWELPAEGMTVARDINDSRWVVGERFDWGPGEWVSFLWTPELGAVDLRDLLPPGTDARLFDAAALNNAGQIVGTGHINGQFGIYRLTVHTLPTPGALAVFAFGVALVARRRR